MNLHKHHLYLL